MVKTFPVSDGSIAALDNSLPREDPGERGVEGGDVQAAPGQRGAERVAAGGEQLAAADTRELPQHHAVQPQQLPAQGY